MTEKQAFELMERGLKVRRPTWKSGYYMCLNWDGIPVTCNREKQVLAYGYRNFGDSDADWEIAK